VTSDNVDSPGLDNGPATIEHRRCIDDEADSKPLRVVMT